MSLIHETLHGRGLPAKALCLTFATLLAVASFAAPASARWANGNNRGFDHGGARQGWNHNYYRAPPAVYQNYGNYGYYAPPVVYGGYGSGLNFNINLP
jgi:hypothetical protein